MRLVPITLLLHLAEEAICIGLIPNRLQNRKTVILSKTQCSEASQRLFAAAQNDTLERNLVSDP
jgi:hypothetical protein